MSGHRLDTDPKTDLEKLLADEYYQYGMNHVNGFGVVKDDKEALKYFLKAAALGHQDAQKNAGIFYFKGRGVEKDYKEAIKWFEKAVNHRKADGYSEFALYVCHYQGYGCERNLHWGLKYLCSSASCSYPEALAEVEKFCFGEINYVEFFKKEAYLGNKTLLALLLRLNLLF
jgi:TPR repeat protein